MSFPIGTIIAWDNALIPADWAVCDGTNGTPNLVGRFIRGASSNGQVGMAGGASDHKHAVPDTDIRCAHNHGGSKDFPASTAGAVTGTAGTGATHATRSHGHNTITVQNISLEDSHGHPTPDTDNASSNPLHIKRVFIMKVN